MYTTIALNRGTKRFICHFIHPHWVYTQVSQFCPYKWYPCSEVEKVSSKAYHFWSFRHSKHRILMVMDDKVKSRSCLSVSLSVWLTEGQPVQWTLPVRQSMPASMVSSSSQNLLGCAGLHNFKQSADIITLDGRSTCRYHLCFVFPHWNDK